MLSTILLFLSIASLILIATIAWAWLLQIGLYWVNSENRRFPSVMVTATVVTFFLILLELLFTFFVARTLLSILLNLLLSICSAVFIIGHRHKIGSLDSFKAWLPTIIAIVPTVLCIFFVFRPFLFEAFLSSTNGMAPTLLGVHVKSDCEICHCSKFASPAATRMHPVFQKMICENFHVTHQDPLPKEISSADRFFVAKFLSINRWDIVAFKRPDQPEIMFCFRVVGLPGETVVIKNGQVTIDGKAVSPPSHLKNLNYLDQLEYEPTKVLWGSQQAPAILGADEYFVLGDFSERAFDSRLWVKGALDRKPYAVPQKNILGVVTHTYWPPSRWRVFR